MPSINTTLRQTDKAFPASEETAILRVIDADINRATEGMRVVEDYARLVLDDCHLTSLYKNLRHDLVSAISGIESNHLLASRETQSDVGKNISTADEYFRPDTGSLILANCKRIEQSLRSLEEFTKILFPAVSRHIEPLRYRAYALARAIQITTSSLGRLDSSKLYLLLDGHGSAEEMTERAKLFIEARVDVLQLRDKKLHDKDLLNRAHALRRVTAGSGTLFIMNDRPDIAVLCRADGIHVGQEELSVKDVRSIVGPNMLIGVSTHTLQQARQAVLDGANYLGVGPTFPTSTKPFKQFPGLDFLQAISREISLPAFAIGGIHRENLPQVLETGIQRIALSSEVHLSTDPAKTVAELLSMLQSASEQHG